MPFQRMMKPMTRLRSKLIQGLPLGLIVAMWLFFFWPMISGQKICGFRDSAYLYYPLFYWIDSVWASGEWPLWNPYCGAGIPVIGDGSSCVFYPGKLVFLLRFLSYPCRYGLFLSLHVLLATVGAYWLARCLKIRPWPAAFAGLAYGFGGPLLTQVSNVIYLIGGAWFPIAAGCMLLVVSERRWIWSWGLAGSLGCMLLGSDPQSVYHLLLLGAAGLVWPTFRVFVWQHLYWAGYQNRSEEFVAQRNTLLLMHVQLLIAIAGGLLLASIQLLPSLEWSKMSVRNLYEHPRNIYEILGSDGDAGQGLLGIPSADSHHSHSYQFSLAPWTLHETFLPNVSGRMYPNNHRYLDYLPGTDRVWFPSLYLGVLSVFLAILSFRFWGRRRKQVLLTWAVMFFTCGAFGWYGVVWALTEFGGFQFEGWGAHVGSLYWAMSTLLPKYVMFRYPAKLFLIASLGLALLAGRSLDEVGRRKKFASFWRPLVVAVGIQGVVCAAVLILHWTDVMGPHLFESMRYQFQNDLGVVDLPSGLWEMKQAVIQSFLVMSGALLLWWAVSRFEWSPRLFVGLLTVLLAFDLAYSNRWVVADIDKEFFEIEPDWDNLKIVEKNGRKIRVVRTFDLWMAPSLEVPQEGPNQLEAMVLQQRRKLFHKHHLMFGVAQDSFSSIESAFPNRSFQQSHFGFALGLTPADVQLENGKILFDGLEKDDYWAKAEWPTSIGRETFGIEAGPGTQYHQWGVKVWPEVTLPEKAFLKFLVLPRTGWKIKLKRRGAKEAELLEAFSSLFSNAVEVPEGNWSVEFRYEPGSVKWGGWISFVAACLWAIFGAVWCFRFRFGSARANAIND